jgi:flagellar L-ring protein precursor FlgH
MIMRTLICWSLIGAILMSVGCTPIKTKAALATCPLAQKIVRLDNGAIFQSAAIRPLFEDRHARNVGDELTVTIGEVTTPTDKASANAAKTGKVDVTLPSAKGTKDKDKDKPENNNFSGTIVVTVIGVLTNGKLVVCGDKLVKYANGDVSFEYIRFSGLVTPGVIATNNTVQSTQVADVQIEYRNADNGESSQTTFSRLDRFFLPKQLYF